MSSDESHRIAYQGEAGAFSEEAVHAMLGPAVIPVPCPQFADAGAALLDGRADAAVLPIENSIHGAVLPTFDLLAAGRLEVLAEIVQPIRLCLMARPGVRLEDVERVLSHPVALAQCERYVRRMGFKAVVHSDTAGAAAEVARSGDAHSAAIAARGAAAAYGLRILAGDVQDRPDNQTRFFLIARRGAEFATPLPARSQLRMLLLVETTNSPGALVGVLQPFAARGINLASLVARPAGTPWSYRFFIEVSAEGREATLRTALDDVAQHAVHVEELGLFGRVERREGTEPSEARPPSA
jgi:prephenate dehydratase